MTDKFLGIIMVLVIDNYDSFVYNLVCYIHLLHFDTMVIRNDKITVSQIAELNPSHIVLSPGPGEPKDAGICIDLIKTYYQIIPILGVCLGHQAIGAAFGAEILRAQKPMHGKTSEIAHNGQGLFQSCQNPLLVGRYHSLIVDKASLSECLKITALSKQGEIMALQHKKYPLYGLQFHPESVLTKQGLSLINAFLTVKF